MTLPSVSLLMTVVSWLNHAGLPPSHDLLLKQRQVDSRAPEIVVSCSSEHVRWNLIKDCMKDKKQ